ncbi:MAG TPA: hypothetical protein VHZ75_00855 [Solirubrobacteraceae bacterium]|jgi:hypothetical protein|nr:hypothetical protein [Solirubrobacteraceae bacterium]
MRPPRLIISTALAAAAIAAAAAAPALAASWHSYSLYNGRAQVEGASGTHSARLTSIVLPDSFKVRKPSERATRLTFGPMGSCRSTGVVLPKLVFSTATSSAAVLAQQLSGGKTYGSGTRAGASYRVAKFTGDKLKGVWVGPTRLPQTWIVVQVTTTPHATECHIGGVRESLGFPLTDAFGTLRASGY